MVAALPGEVTWNEMPMPEGDWHTGPRAQVLDVLRRHWDHQPRTAYVSSALPVYYPEEPRFAPDLLVVLDAEQRRRDKWVCSAEEHGLDWVMEMHVGGDRKKAAEDNVQRYARLGIPEYFIFDGGRLTLEGYRQTAPGAGVYARMVSREGRYVSEILGLELQVEKDGLRFWSGDSPLLRSSERIRQLEEQYREQLEHRIVQMQLEIDWLKQSAD
ncbi:Uma2 family endonuclease [Corallococcus sp. bb12-1]|uniref:Uma2 family endonuclease n=1 Tax=Corallococcus sp. bb12-1 TaxID=2996784 RepID=UPI00226DDC55|nr:Uma2 family endonuclease [Corallococcus sp. bb12-1]